MDNKLLLILQLDVIYDYKTIYRNRAIFSRLMNIVQDTLEDVSNEK